MKIRRMRPTGDDFMEYYDDIFVREFAARTVTEEEESIDIGVLDHEGKKLRAVKKRNPIGFIWKR